MDANLKLLKKKRVAHTSSKLPHLSCEEQKLPPDDFVFNIMRDMDKKKNVLSYQQLQEFKSQRRQDASQNEDNFSHQNSFHSKQIKKMLPKKTFPLMKKCKTNLKHLTKNRCIPKPRAHVGNAPKPRAHVGNVPKPRAHVGNAPKQRAHVGNALKPRDHGGNTSKPQFKHVDKNITKFQHGGSSGITKTKQNSNKFRSTISQPNFKVCKSSNSQSTNKETVNYVKRKAQVEEQLSSSDDDDDAFEDFVQKANEKSDSSSSDTNSRLIIHRKGKTKSKHKNKRLKCTYSDKKENKHVSKITSRRLSDSSESEEQEMLRDKNKNTSFKKRKYSEHESPMRLQKNTNNNFSDEVTYNNLSEDDPHDLEDLNYDSSDSESNLETPISGVLPINQSQPSENKVVYNTLNMDFFNFNSCSSEPTKSVPNCDVPCYVRLIRDPEIDKKAKSFCSITPILPTTNMVYFSDDDCIVIDENSDNEEVPKSLLNSSFSTTLTCEDTRPDDCVAICERSKDDSNPQSGDSNTSDFTSSEPSLLNAPEINVEVQMHNLDGIKNLSEHHSKQIGFATLNKDALNLQSLGTETDMDECVVLCDKSKTDVSQNIQQLCDSSISDKTTNPDLFSQTKNKFPSMEHNEDHTINSEIQDFNVKIVAVHSLPQLEKPLIKPSASETDIEVIDLSDDESQVSGILIQSNAAKERVIGMSDSSKIHQNENTVIEDENNSSLKCEPNPKILEILNTIDFERIKEAISNIKVQNSKNEFCQIGESSTSNLLLPGTSIPIPISGKDKIDKEINSTYKIGFQEQNSKLDENQYQLHANFEQISEKTDSQVRYLNEFPDKLSDGQMVESVNNVPNCATNNNVKNFHTSNLKEKDTNKSIGISLGNCKDTNSLINVCATGIVAEVSSENSIKETELFQKVNSKNPSIVENRTVVNINGNLSIHSKQNFKYVQNQSSETMQSCRNTVCKDLQTTELLTKTAAKNYKQDSNTFLKTTTSQTTISNKEKCNVSEIVDNECKIPQVRNEKNIQNLGNVYPVKKEEESPSDDMDVTAAMNIYDLKSSNKQVLTLLDLYKIEYEKYKQIKNTETNVSAGLKLLHDNQVNRLKHLSVAIKNLAKHDACFYIVNQEDSCNVKTHMKNDFKYKVDVKIENSKKPRCEGPLTGKDIQPATKCDSAGPSREKIVKLMMNLKCAQCGKPATARCQGCAEVYYCSPHCGEQSWIQGHHAVCKKT